MTPHETLHQLLSKLYEIDCQEDSIYLKMHMYETYIDILFDVLSLLSHFLCREETDRKSVTGLLVGI